MGNNEERKVEKRKPSLGLSILMLAIAAALILSGVVIYGQDVHIMLIFSAIIVGAVGILYLHYSYEELEKGIIEGIMTTMQACLILYTVGVLIGTWIHSGVVPSMIYYGLSILSPSIFLFATLVICSIVSLATGTSWGTSGTVGIALLGIAMGLGIPAPLTVGVIVSGAYAGDKMSPLSDTTNLAPAVSGTDLFQHIRAMCWTTGPTYVIVAVITIVLGFQYAGGTLDYTKIGGIQAVIAKEFWVSPIALLAPIAVIVLSALRKPALPSLWAGVFIAAAFMFIEGYDYGAVLNVMQNGYTPTVSAELAEAADEAALAAVVVKHALDIDVSIAKEIGKDIVELDRIADNLCFCLRLRDERMRIHKDDPRGRRLARQDGRRAHPLRRRLLPRLQLLPRRPVSRHRDAGHDVQGDLRQARPASEDALALARGLRHADLRPGAVEHLRRLPRGAVQYVSRGVRPLRLPQLDEPRDCDNHDLSRHRHLLAREERRACARRQDTPGGARLAVMV